MPQISKVKLSAVTEKELLKTLNLVLAKISKEEDLDTFLLSLLTSTERLMLAKRLAIVILLKEGLPEKHIADSLHVTRVTVSRLRYFYEARASGGYEIAFRILENEKLAEGIRKTLIDLVSYSIRAAGGRVKV